jgi:hypothetical protein
MPQAWPGGSSRLLKAALLLAALLTGTILGWVLAPDPQVRQATALGSPAGRTVPVRGLTLDGAPPDLESTPAVESPAGSAQVEPGVTAAGESALSEAPPTAPPASEPEAGGGEGGSFGAPVGGSAE